jgi:hypothetical protein
LFETHFFGVSESIIYETRGLNELIKGFLKKNKKFDAGESAFRGRECSESETAMLTVGQRKAAFHHKTRQL